MNDAVILLCGVILLLAVLPMVLMGRAFKGASRKGAAGTEVSPAEGQPGAANGKTGPARTDSSSFSNSGGGKEK